MSLMHSMGWLVLLAIHGWPGLAAEPRLLPVRDAGGAGGHKAQIDNPDCTLQMRWNGAGWIFKECNLNKCVGNQPSCDLQSASYGGGIDEFCACGTLWPAEAACLAVHRKPNNGGAPHIICWTVGCAPAGICLSQHLLEFPTEFTPACLCQ